MKLSLNVSATKIQIQNSIFYCRPLFVTL